MEAIALQSLYYSNRAELEVEDVADSLLAFKALLEHAPAVLGELFPELSVQSVRISLKQIQTGSLLEDLAVKFVWGKQEALDEDLAKLRARFPLKDAIQNHKFLSVLVFAMILGGGVYYLMKAKAPTTQIEVVQNNQRNVLVIGSQISGIPVEQLQKAVDDALAKNPQVSREGVRAAIPAKREDGASIAAGKDSEVTITPSAVRAMPMLVPVEEGTESIEDVDNVELQIRATDLDSVRRGWAAVIPILGDRRVKVHLDMNVPPEKLVGKKAVRADITVIFKTAKDGERVPVLAHVRRIRR